MSQASRPGEAIASPGALTLVVFASLCSVLAPLNSTMVAVALPEIRDDFGLSSGSVGWLVSAYLIAMAVAQPVAGRMGDQLGRGRVVRMGLLAFVAASVASSVAPSFTLLVLSRVLQALFGAGLIPNAMALIRERAAAGELGRLNGYNAAAIAAAAGLGPLLGAMALAAGSWRFVFPISVPFALGALVLLPRLGLSGGSRASSDTDWIGTVEYAALLIAITWLLGSENAIRGPWPRVAAWGLFLAGLVGFAWSQRRAVAPVAAWGLLRHRSFGAACAQILLTNLAMYTTLLMVPFLVSDVLHGGARQSGLLLGGMALFMGLAAPPGGRLSDHHGRRVTALLGAMLVLASALLLAFALLEGVSFGELAAILALLGSGVGVATGAANTAAIESVPAAQAGTAAGTSSMMRYVGSIVGAGVLAGMLNAAGGTRPDAQTFLMLDLLITAIALAGIAAAALIHRFPDSPSLARGATTPSPQRTPAR